MGVEQRLRDDAAALARELAAVDEEAALERILAAAMAVAEGGENTTAPAGRGPAPGVTGTSPDTTREQRLQELLACQQRAGRERNPSCARRAAELLELLDRDDEAVDWWRCAAAGGDPDAIDYVAEFLSR